MKISFYGAVQGVTGSRYLVEEAGIKIMVDCGLFQEAHNDLEKDPLPVDAKNITAVILTHAHIDHTGYLPRLVKDGFKGKIYCSKGTFALSSILLRDSAMIEEERAARQDARKPLYTVQDAERALQFFAPTPFDTAIKIGTTFTFTLINSGHILGASFVILSNSKEKLTFSGDLGRPAQLIMKAPPYIKQTDYLVLESTYGNRLHSQEDSVQAIGQIINQTLSRGGIVIIPSFAVGRTQEILYILYQLKEKGSLPNCPIFLDSPMAIKVTDLMCEFQQELKLPASLCKKVTNMAQFTPTQSDSRDINAVQGPAIIIAGSGMSEGGRVLHHFKHRISDEKNCVIFVGYQAKGTLGRALTEGQKEIILFGKEYFVKATIKNFEMLSAHADYNEILDWLSHVKTAPKKIFLTHGEPEAAAFLKQKIEERFGWKVIIPIYAESFELV